MKSLRAIALAALCLLGFGCATKGPKPPPSLVTRIGAGGATLPGRMYGDIMVVEAKWDRYGPYHFLIDTGSSRTLVSPELAHRYAAERATPDAAVAVPVIASDGTTTTLPAGMLDRLDLGAARFANIPVLIYDFSPLTAQLGIKIDGVLGFSLFRHTLLTLDYPSRRVIIRPVADSLLPLGSIVPFNNSDKTPSITIGLGSRSFPALIDSGSKDTLNLDTASIGLRFAYGPVDGPTVGTLTGDRVERIGRLADTLYLGEYTFPRPVAVAGDQPATLGAGILKYFSVTFDQERDRAIFHRDSPDPIAIPPVRSAGLSFDKTPVYWRVVGVIPGSPAESRGVRTGDLVTRIDGEVVGEWDAARYDRLLGSSAQIAFTFLDGTTEKTIPLNVVALVP